jgi:hypothetical protein
MSQSRAANPQGRPGIDAGIDRSGITQRRPLDRPATDRESTLPSIRERFQATPQQQTPALVRDTPAAQDRPAASGPSGRPVPSERPSFGGDRPSIAGERPSSE